MDLLALRYFQAVARREHLTRAAEALHVAQPSLSRTVARLEADLGVALFDREGRRLRLNRCGAAFLARVDRVLGELDDARRELADLADAEQRRVTVASETLLTVAALLTVFRTRHPGVEVTLRQSSAPAMAEQLTRGDIDVGFASTPPSAPGIVGRELVREEVLLALPRGHPLAARDRVEVAALGGEPFITLRPGHWQRTLADRLFARAGVEPRPVCEGDEPAATLELVASGLGLTLVPAMGARAWRDERVVVRPLDTGDAAGAERVLWILRRREGYLSRAARDLGDLAAVHFAGAEPG